MEKTRVENFANQLTIKVFQSYGTYCLDEIIQIKFAPVSEYFLQF